MSAAAASGRRGIVVTMAVVAVQTGVLGALSAATGSASLFAEAMHALADLGVQAFLLVGVVRAGRPPDDAHPLGYGQEAFYWSLFAAIGIFVGGGGAALREGVTAWGSGEAGQSYLLGYVVLAVIALMDAYTTFEAVRALRAQGAARGRSAGEQFAATSDPAVRTLFLDNIAGVLGALIAIGGLALHQLTGDGRFDAAASILIGALLIALSVVLLRANRDLVTSPSVPPATLARLRDEIAGVPGVRGVADVLAVIVGPGTVLVAARVVFAGDPASGAVEDAAERVERRLRESGHGMVGRVYVTPVAGRAPDGGPDGGPGG
ncbi:MULTISPECIES: cation diffusion facilitator family transporter [Actinomadura]|uniref:Cation diffusion facilitator family transporter n=1 Tax=Actinomadura yumaensis TaxID=111807 RepID=A0ABW2D1C8_9ACTN|nr:cation diffusion facilitator family transporter [Actinomadura sp. J1-007]MWK38835.1 cation diffusion facilitator family transporter [Actinomadura sp. J1-007]